MTLSEGKINRRQLLQYMSAAVCLPVLPVTARATQNHNHRLILIELSGANDGLNTIVPYRDDRYYELRPRIALNRDRVIPLESDLAFHPALQPLMPLWQDNDIAVVQGLGYPKPNRSHFKSIAIWESGGDGHGSGRDGWMTHAIEHAYAKGRVDAHGISFGGGMNVFASSNGTWLSLNTSRQLVESNSRFLLRNNPVQNPLETGAGLDMIRQRTQQLGVSLDRFSAKLSQGHEISKISAGRLGQQLNHVVNMIAAGVDTPVYKVSLGGFDTHENQPGRHTALLEQLAAGLNGLKAELLKRQEWNNTLVMTYSEFGRRARENRSRGTDHGTAAPHFLAGGAVNGGLFGKHPDLGDLENDDLKFTMDYRSAYDRLLTDWLDIDSHKYEDYRDQRLKGLLEI